MTPEPFQFEMSSKGEPVMSETLVAYFSASGQTARLAKTLAKVVNGDCYEMRPEQAYTAADLD
jgi:flavodoxin